MIKRQRGRVVQSDGCVPSFNLSSCTPLTPTGGITVGKWEGNMSFHKLVQHHNPVEQGFQR